MPEFFEKDGYRFFFYSNDTRPMHVHVRYGGGEAVFEVERGVAGIAGFESPGVGTRRGACIGASSPYHQEVA